VAEHPDFDDQGAVSWFTDFQAALAEAQRTGKRLFVESGREACGNCRVLVEKVIPQPEVRDYLNEHFVCLADDCDAMAPEVMKLGMAVMPQARTLPFVLFADGSGKPLGGHSGGITAEAFLKLLRGIVEEQDAAGC
jgi:thioredoxin-related protein